MQTATTELAEAERALGVALEALDHHDRSHKTMMSAAMRVALARVSDARARLAALLDP
ncbi:MAG: hypothetical protein IPH07_16315 [Deltaproteobacteria bacterium]|nr:hypothetical protein [Deltaproteobacteria bacterium]MBK8239342.1 hypothetical protein [Deltaproteobacteria bacterium]MBK8719583.1 hypothetical protein [Deltaproteobacteria bacterium]MBP7291487.1 hypothetical protein [Nannocystaceae bacterium]